MAQFNDNLVLPEKNETQAQVENAFIFKDFLSINSLLKWLVLSIVVILVEIISYIQPFNLYFFGPTIYIMRPYWQETVHFYTALFAFGMVNYLILYVGVKLYRGFIRYVIPVMKASADLPFRLHQKLLDM